MKRFICTFIAVFALTIMAVAQDTKGPKMQFYVTTIDYGTIEKGADPLRKFKFTNVGNKPLIIKRSSGSCGCTVPIHPREPIMPGESSFIDVRYDTQRIGPFQKVITISTNETDDTHILTVKGEVKDTPTQPSVPLSGSGLKQ